MNKEELERDLELRKGRETFYAELLANEQAAVADTEDKLAEAEKPELEHGDYGIDGDNDSFVVVEQATLYGTPKAFFESRAGQIHADKTMSPDFRIGNIFRDLEALAAPLKAFMVGVGCFSYDPNRSLEKPFRFIGYDKTLDEFREISMKIRRLIHTAERQNENT